MYLKFKGKEEIVLNSEAAVAVSLIKSNFSGSPHRV